MRPKPSPRRWGTLVTVNDQEEHRWLVRNFSSFDGVNRALWIGLIDPDPSRSVTPDVNTYVNHFVWASGQPVTFFCWSTAGQPSQGTGRMKMVQPDPSWPHGRQSGDLKLHGWLNGVVEVPWPFRS
jgi:hypothetical protein